MVDLTVIANQLAIVMEVAIDLIAAGDAEEAARILEINIQFVRDETRIH